MIPRRVGTARDRLLASAAAAIATALLLFASFTDTWRAFEERALSLLFAKAGTREWNPKVSVIAYDDETYNRLGTPVPRELLVRLLEALAATGVKSVAFDIVYDRPAASGPQGDEVHARVARELGRVAFATRCIPNPPAEGSGAPKVVIPRGALPAYGCRAVRLPIEPIASAATLAHVQLERSASGYVHRVPLITELSDGSRFPGLALAAFALGSGIDLQQLEQEPRALRVGNVRLPTSEQGSVWMTVREPLVAQDGRPGIHSLADLSALVGDSKPPRLPPAVAAQFKGQFVLFGDISEINGDYGVLADGQRKPLVLVHAALLSDLIEGRPLREAGMAIQLGVAILFAVIMLMAALVLRGRNLTVAFAAAFIVPMAVSNAALHANLVLPYLAPSFCGLFSFLAAMAVRFGLAERERRVLSEAFGAYVSAPVLDRVLSDPDHYLSLGGARKTLTVLFSDITGYTRLSNQLSPEQVILLLREYLDAMTGLVTDAGGRVDKIIGDGIMAVFGDPIPDEHHARSAVQVALAMQRALDQRNADWTRRGLPELRIRIGIATGEVFVGNVGSRRSKIEYTVIGPAVNLASRLEGRAPPGGVMVSAETRRACGDGFSFRALPPETIKGYDEPVPVFLALDPEAQAKAS